MLKAFKIASIEEVGDRDTYDLQVEDNNNFFLDNGILTHNSGKGTMTKLLWRISDRASKIVWRGDQPHLEPCHIEKLGRITNAALINNEVPGKDGRPKIDKDTGEMMINYGLLFFTDYLILEEARQLIKPGKDNEEIQEIFMTCAEPIGSSNNIYTKRLKNYNDTIETPSSVSWFATTHPVGKIKNVLANTGLLQRSLFYPRMINDDVRQQMNKLSSLALTTKLDTEKFDIEFSQLREELDKVVDFASKNTVTFKESEIPEMSSYLYEKLSWFMGETGKISKTENRDILQSFVARYRNHLLVLAHHSAVMRYSLYVEKEDIEYAFNMMQEIFKSLLIWIELNVEEEKETREENKDYVSLIHTALTGKMWMYKSDIVDFVAAHLRVHKKAVYRKLNEFAIGENRLIEFDDSEGERSVKVFLANRKKE